MTLLHKASPLARRCPLDAWLTGNSEYLSSQQNVSFYRNIQVYILVRMIVHRARGTSSVEEASSSWVVEGASSSEVALEKVACSLEGKVASSSVEEVVPGSR